MTPNTQITQANVGIYERAVMFATRDKPSVSYIQRRLEISYADAAALISRMQREGLISEPSPLGKREILVPYTDRPAQPDPSPEDAGNHDCLAKRRDGEPMFILLGRDPDAHNIVRTWAERRLAAGGDAEHCQMGLDTADRMKAYASDPANAPKSAPPASAYAQPDTGDVAALREALGEIKDEIRFADDPDSVALNVIEGIVDAALSKPNAPGAPEDGGA